MQRIRRLWRLLFPPQEETGEHALEKITTRLNDELIEARSELSSCVAEADQLANIVQHEQYTAQRYYQSARLALRRGEEDLAREAVQRHLRALQQVERYQAMSRQVQDDLTQLQEIITVLDDACAHIEFRRQQLALRHRMITMRRSLLDSLYKGQDLSEVDQAEEKVRYEEHLTEAYQQLMTDSAIPPALTPTLERITLTPEAILAQLHAEVDSPATQAHAAPPVRQSEDE